MSNYGAAKSRVRTTILLSAATLLGTLAAGAVQAQNDPNAPGVQQPGQPGQPGGGRGGFGNFLRQMPFATGQVTGGDPATNTIIITSQFGGSQTIHASGDTKMVAVVQIDVTKLKVGDSIQVQGVPNTITASSITAGEMPDFLTAGMRGGRGGGPGAAPGAPGAPGAAPNGNGAPPRPQNQAMAAATGKITSLEPLTVAISDEVSVVLKMGPNAKVMKLMPATINNIKLGDTVFAAGATGADGSFTATGIGINMGGMMGGMMGGRGMRGFGGPGGANGAGGPGGGFNGFGGGGRGGRRGNRGGGAGGNGQPGADGGVIN